MNECEEEEEETKPKPPTPAEKRKGTHLVVLHTEFSFFHAKWYAFAIIRSFVRWLVRWFGQFNKLILKCNKTECENYVDDLNLKKIHFNETITRVKNRILHTVLLFFLFLRWIKLRLFLLFYLVVFDEEKLKDCLQLYNMMNGDETNSLFSVESRHNSIEIKIIYPSPWCWSNFRR